MSASIEKKDSQLQFLIQNSVRQKTGRKNLTLETQIFHVMQPMIFKEKDFNTKFTEVFEQIQQKREKENKPSGPRKSNNITPLTPTPLQVAVVITVLVLIVIKSK